MGSTFSIVVRGRDRVKLEAAADAGLAEAHRLDRLLSNYRSTSEWSGVNRDAGARAVRVSSELFALLSACLEYSRQSDGAFDITVGPLMKVWGFYKDEGRLPRPEDVSLALDRTGYRHVHLDSAARTVRFDRTGRRARSRRHRQGLRRRSRGVGAETGRRAHRAGFGVRQQHLRHGRPA